MSLPSLRSTPNRIRGSTVGSSVTVFNTAPPQPSFAARITRRASSVGGADDSIKGFVN